MQNLMQLNDPWMLTVIAKKTDFAFCVPQISRTHRSLVQHFHRHLVVTRLISRREHNTKSTLP